MPAMLRWAIGFLAMLCLVLAMGLGWVRQRTVLSYRLLWHHPGAVEPGEDDQQVIAAEGMLIWKTTARLGEGAPKWYPHPRLPEDGAIDTGNPAYTLRRTLFSLDPGKPPPAYLSREWTVPMRQVSSGLILSAALLALPLLGRAGRIRNARRTRRAH